MEEIEMKISKILSAVSAMAVAASMAIPAAAGNGAPIGVPDNWELKSKDTLATRVLIGDAASNPAFGENTKENQANTWDKLFPATTVRITVQGDYFGSENWDASGSIVVTGHMLGWAQVDWQLGAGCLNEDGTPNPEKNANINKIYCKDNNKYTIEATLQNFIDADKSDADLSGEAGLYTCEKNYAQGLDQNYASLVIQSFNEDSAKGWNVLGFEFLDANGGSIIKEGEVAMGDECDPSTGKAKDGSTGNSANNNGGAAANNNGGAAANNNGGAAANNSGSSSSSSGSKSSSSSTAKGSDASSKTGAASGLALAGIALAGAAFVISKKK